MVGPTLISTGDKVDNDNSKKVGVLGAYNLPIVEWSRELETDAAHPGETLMPATGAGGEDHRQLVDDKDHAADSFCEFDPGQIADCSKDYTAGEDIPIIPFFLNSGGICRNIQCVDPAGAVEPMTPLSTSSGTSGSLKVVTEPTLKSTGTPYGFQSSTAGLNDATGQMLLIQQRIPAIQLYYLADPNAAYTDVVAIRW